MLHLDAGQRVQRTQGFVQQQQAWLVDQRAGQGHALLLPAGQGRRPLVGAFGQTHLGQRLFGPWPPVAEQAQADVVDHSLPGQQARVLEHQPHLFAVVRQALAGAVDGAPAWLVQPGQQAQQGALAAAAAPDHGDELARRDVQVDALKHLAFAEGLADAFDRQRDALADAVQRGHCAPPLAW